MKKLRLLALAGISLAMLATTSCCSTCVERAEAHRAAKAGCSKCCGGDKADCECCGKKKAEGESCCGCSKKS